MDKLKLETPNLTEKNIENIAKLFPNVISETKDGNGDIKRAIDFEKLKQELSDSVIEGDESYDFTWVGKREAILEANKPIRKTLRPDRKSSVDWENTQNIYIEGDNLEALKLLQESYLGKIKMIYIDPPYNTGKDFVYKDNFTQDKDSYEDELGIKDDEGNKLFQNTESNGRFHSDWCSMIYPRLKLARNLLSDDGVIFISIDDNEVDNLKKICDEVFGKENHIACIVRNTNSSKNQSLFVSVSHEYCMIYSKNIEVLKDKHSENKWSVPKNNIKEYLQKVSQLKEEGLSNEQITNELKILTKYPRFIDFTNYWYFDEKGLYRKDNLGGVKNGNTNPVFNPITKEFDPIPPGGFRYSPEKMKALIEENKIHFHTDGSLPVLKRYLYENESQRPKSIMSDDQRPDYSLMKEFNTPFDNPKQLAFMSRICSITDKDSIILDFFSGSATTAHAVMQLNAEDNGNRKFIMVQLPELCDEKSEAFKAGYKNICEIGKERIRRAGKKILEEKAHLNLAYKDNKLTQSHTLFTNSEVSIAEQNEVAKNLDIGFRVFKVDDTNMNDVYYAPKEYNKASLDNLLSNIKQDRTDEDLLYGVLLDWGVELSLSHKVETIDGKKIHIVNDNELGADLIACFEENVSETVVKEIAKKKPTRVVFKDSSFMSDDHKINVEEIFKLSSPNTTVKVI